MDLNGLLGFVLVLVRVGSLVAFLPFLGQRSVPVLVKVLVSFALAAVIYPVSGVAVPALSWPPGRFFLVGLAEMLYGAVLGFSAKSLFWAMRSAGQLMGRQMGMALATTADPTLESNTTLVATVCEVIGVMIFFAVDGHHLMVQAVHASFAQWPVGAFLSAEFLRRVSVFAAAAHLRLAFQLAAPLMALMFLVSLVMAVLARLVPEINILLLGFPVRIGVGLIGLTLLVPLIAQYGASLSRLMIGVLTGAAGGA